MRTSIILLFLLSAPLALLKSQTIGDSPLSHFSKSPTEKVHIHFDRDLYRAGETIFFKIYVSEDGSLSSQSKNVYAEWYDEKNELLKQQVFPLYYAGAAGSFDLPSNYTGKNIRLIVYTRWMLNAHNTPFIYNKWIALSKENKSESSTTKPLTSISLFPEGGSLIEGLSSKIAFLANNNLGYPVKITATIRNQRNEVVTECKTQHNGMGFFVLKPLAGENYFIDWQDDLGNRGLEKIIVHETSGVTLTVYPTDEATQVTIQNNLNAENIHKTYTLQVAQEGIVSNQKEVLIKDNNPIRITIPLIEAKTGVMAITLFDPFKKPVAERIIFVDQEDYLAKTAINIDKKSLTNRSKNTFTLVLNDTSLNNLSVSIVDPAFFNNNHSTIISSLLLTSELKGFVYKANDYFDLEGSAKQALLDLVMLTHGWRRYNWDKTQTTQYEPEKDYMHLKIETDNSLANQDMNLILIAKDSTTRYVPVVFDSNGIFEKKGVYIFDTINAFYAFNKKFTNKQKLNVTFSNGLLNSNMSAKTVGSYAPKFSEDVENSGFQLVSKQTVFDQYKNQGILSPITVNTRVKSRLELLDEKYTNAIFRGGTPYSFDMVNDRLLGYRNIFNYLMGKVPSLQITYGRPPDSANGPYISFVELLPVVRFARTDYQPLFLLDEMPVRLESIVSIPLFDIAYIKVFQPPFVGASLGGAGGAIAVYTKRGDEQQPQYPYSTKGMELVKINGYSAVKEFYNPTYDKSYNPSFVDARKTLYWNPNIILDQRKKEQKIEFYNNDISKKLVIVLEGISADGKLTRIVKQIE